MADEKTPVKMIESLTPEQEATFDHYVEKWLKIGLSTERMNKEKAIEYARMAYQVGSHDDGSPLKFPDKYYFVASPNACVELDCQLSPGLSPKESLDATCYGNQEASWLSFYNFFQEQCSIKEVDILNGMFGLAEHCGWWVPREDYIIFQDRPEEIHMQNKVLHNDKGMAIKYTDGWGLWAINGITVNEQIVMRPETLTIDQIDGEQNNDVRSIMLDRFGWPRYIKETNATCVDTRHNEVENQEEALFDMGDSMRLLCTCPTGRMFALGVPKQTEDGTEIKTCIQAQDWLAAFSEFKNQKIWKDFQPKINILGRT
jgi:hypothetical protein